MASSRLEKIGTIYTRITGLMRAGALKFEDKPIWYEVYEAFPPKNEPLSLSNTSLPKILYPEDSIRAKFHKLQAANETINLADSTSKTKSQRFIKAHQVLESGGQSSSDELFDAALENLNTYQSTEEPSFRSRRSTDEGITSSFKNAQKLRTEGDKTMISKIDLHSVFKDDSSPQ